MNIIQSFQNLINSITESFSRIFSPNRDKYPEIGVSPYKGEPNTEDN